jgi:hypothetical protein
MTLSKLMIVPMFAMALFAVGCGGDCVSQCEDAKECDDATAEDKEVDCEKACEAFKKQAADAGCEDEYDDLESCAGGEDACEDNEDACKEEVDAFSKCMTPDT